MSPQQTIAHYRITAKLGEGGMGEVWRATDTKLNRDVAIKILPEAFAQDVDRMARFEREAQVLASLNHPNIAAIYGIERGAIVMELVEGEDLKGPVTLDMALDYSRQIAAGLEAAHEKGIVHRDLKPANIKVSPGGQIKLLDFGLAKVSEVSVASAGAGSPTISPTLSLAITQRGGILGTPAYMAPEQARGNPVDKRADIWAFGVILYELITGNRLFGGETANDELAAVIAKEPDLSAAPERVQGLLAACLEKDPRRRLRDIGDWHRLLLDVRPVSVAAVGHFWLPWAFAAALAGVAAFGLWRGTPVAAPAAVNWQTSLTLPPDLEPVSPPEISPDGTMAVAATRAGLLLRSLSSLEWVRIKGTEGGTHPFWAPDSRSIGFYRINPRRSILRVRVPDGVPEVVREQLNYFRAASWSRHDQILSATGDGLEIGPAEGGPGAVLLPSRSPEGLLFPTMPEFLPDAEHFIFLAYDPRAAGSAEGGHGIYLAGWHDGKWTLSPTRLRAGALSAHYSPLLDGSLLFVRGDDLYAQHLNLAHARIEGEAALLVRGVASQLRTGQSTFSISSGGALVWQPGKADASQLTWFDREGRALAATGAPESWDQIAISPDERHVVAIVSNTDIAQMGVLESEKSGFLPLKTSAPNRLAEGGCDWISGTNDILYEENTFALAQVSTAGGPAREWGPITVGYPRYLRQISADGKQVLINDKGRLKLFPFPPEGGVSPAEPAIGDESYGSLSPDGKWVVYVALSQKEVFARPLLGSTAPRQISNSRGTSPSNPTWRGDGKEILYVEGGEIRSVAVDLARGQFAAPVLLFKARVAPSTIISRMLAVTRDGSRILLPVMTEQTGAPLVHIMADWTAAVKQH
jgi:hypothetical protein